MPAIDDYAVVPPTAICELTSRNGAIWMIGKWFDEAAEEKQCFCPRGSS